MKMKNLGYYNGRYDLLENMQIPMNDRGYYFGDGVYDASYMENNRIFDLDSQDVHAGGSGCGCAACCSARLG